MLEITNTSLGCSTSDAVNVNVGTQVPAFSLPDIPYCPSDGAVSLGATAPSGMANYSWSPAALVSAPNIQSPTTLNPPPSSPTVFTLTIRNASGCDATATQTITPNITPPIAGDNAAICLNESVQLGSAANSTGSYSWSPAAGLDNANAPTPIFTPTASGTYSFTVTKTEAGCSSTAEVTIFVTDFQLPVLENQTVCEGACVQIGTTPQAQVAYVWTPSPGLSNPFEANPLACVTETTTYTLTATNISGCVATTTVTVSVSNEAAPIASITDIFACLGDDGLQFDLTVSPAGSYEYQWSPNDGSLSNIYSEDPIVAIFGAEVKKYTVTVTNPTNGCSTTATAELEVIVCPRGANCVMPTNDPPSFTLGSCTGSTPNADAQATISNIVNGDQAAILQATAWPATGGPAYGDAGNANVMDGNETFTGLMHNTDYVVRIWNGDNDCFVDVPFTTPALAIPNLSVNSPVTNSCPLTTVNLTDLVFTGLTDANATTGTVSYHTASNPLNSSDLTVPDPTMAATGTTYYIRKETAQGCVDIVPIVVNETPCPCPAPPAVTITETVVVCGVSPATFNYTVANGPASITTSNGTLANFSTTTLNNGSGTFTYTPAAGEVGMTINVTATIPDPDGSGSCAGAVDLATVTINATANAGTDQTVCGNAPVSITATANGAGMWTGGTGTFANASMASTTYTPTMAEIGTTVTLTWTTADPDGAGPCTSATDSIELTFLKVDCGSFPWDGN
ncbi:MAG: hypothetical protein R2795_18535 [Saprospiraceae bacterium]